MPRKKRKARDRKLHVVAIVHRWRIGAIVTAYQPWLGGYALGTAATKLQLSLPASIGTDRPSRIIRSG